LSPKGEGKRVRVNVELPEDFSMNQTLSLYLLDTLRLIDPESPNYALDVLTLVESILENPDLILRRQLDRLKGEKVAELKAQGMEYDQRMEELEKLEYPKPCREFVYSTFNAFSEKHPWVGQENIRPKSIAREMFEQYHSFSDYIKAYELQRIEGLLLRHLTSVYKVLRQTVPESAKNDTLREMEAYLAALLRQVDSSLIEEWERMKNPTAAPRETKPEAKPPGAEEAARDITRDPRQFTAAVRARVLPWMRCLALDQFEEAVAALESGGESGSSGWTAASLRTALDPYYTDHERISLEPEARNTKHTHVVPSEDRKSWRVMQVLVDPEGHNDWQAEFVIDLAASKAAEVPVMRLVGVGPIGA
jgi:hypothetical protein